MCASLTNKNSFDPRAADWTFLSFAVIHSKIILELTATIHPVEGGTVATNPLIQDTVDRGMPTPFGPIPGDQSIAQLLNVFSTGGARGLLIGIALGVLMTGLRIIFGVDRPYGGQ